MAPEIVHEQIMCVVHEKVQGIEHFFVVPNQWHFQILINNLSQLGFCFILFMYQLNLSLFFTFFQQKVWISDNLIRLFYNFINIWSFTQELCIVLLVVFQTLLCEKLLTHVSSLIKFFCSQLDIDKVGLLKNLIHFIHFLSLQFIQMAS